MTKTQATDLQAKWGQQGDPPLCEHPIQELAGLARSDKDYLKGYLTSLSWRLVLPSLASLFCICWRVFPVPPAPAFIDEFLIQVDPIGQERIGKGAQVPREAASHIHSSNLSCFDQMPVPSVA